jgi:hypothetical protein
MSGGDRVAFDATTVVLRVTDTGVGMTKETLHRAFQPLFTTKALGKGSGLGLTMVNEFARRCGGSVQISSSIGEGTSVVLRFPGYLSQGRLGCTINSNADH